jgi:hypothetical protein
MAALADAAILADDAGKALEFARELIVEFDDLVEGFGDLRIQPVIIVDQADRKIAATEGPQGHQNLAAVKLVPWSLDVHGLLLGNAGKLDMMWPVPVRYAKFAPLRLWTAANPLHGPPPTRLTRDPGIGSNESASGEFSLAACLSAVRTIKPSCAAQRRVGENLALTPWRVDLFGDL